MSIFISPIWGLISVTIAASLTYNWQSENPDLFAFMTYEDKLMPILSNPQAEGLRYYIGLHDLGSTQNVPKVIVVGVDAQNNDIIDQSSPDSKILNFALPCPEVCDKGKSALSHDLPITNFPVQSGNTRPIPFDAAVSMTQEWQAAHDIKSIYVSKADLQDLFQHYGQNQLRFYIGKTSAGALRTIVVGVDQAGNDMIGTDVYSSEQSICTGSEGACGLSSPLYHE